MNVVVIGRKKFVGPAGWEDITPRHYQQLLNWRVKLNSNPSGRWALLQLWYGIRYADSRLLDDEQRVDLLGLLDFVDTRPERWMLPRLRIRGRRYIGPGDGLEHLSFGEFMYAESARNRYLNDGQPTDLSALLASLYRPQAWPWEPQGAEGRRLFDTRIHLQQTARIGIVSEPVRQGVLQNYLGCLDQFPIQFPHLFSQTDEGGGSGGSWLDVGISLARQTGALGTFLEMERTNLYLVLTALDALMKDNEELKAKAEQWKN